MRNVDLMNKGIGWPRITSNSLKNNAENHLTQSSGA